MTPRLRSRGWLVATLTAVIVIGLVIIIAEVHSAGRQQQSRPRLAASCSSGARQLSVLLIGNSYTSANDLPGMLGHVMCQSSIATNLQVEAMTVGGATLHDWLGIGAAEHLSGHDVVVLQEQSQISGLEDVSHYYQDSLTAVDELGEAATNTNAQVILFQTWAHRYGDPANEMLYYNYAAMQARIDSGYDRYLTSLRSGPATNAKIAPAGNAWAWVRQHDPSLFNALYDPDGSHPSAAGTYLASLLLSEAISQHELPAAVWKPSQLSIAQASALQTAARIVWSSSH